MRVGELEEQYGVEVAGALGVLWGKSRERAGGRTGLLLGHLFDSAAVAELVWDRFLAPVTRVALDEVAGGGGGRRLFAWLCGLHDCGKATPAHQRLWAEGAESVRRVGLGWVESAAVAGVRRGRWGHDRAGGLLVREVLGGAGWLDGHVDWVWPLVAGHHGVFPSEGGVAEPRAAKGQLRGRGVWRGVQRAVFEVFTRELGFGGLGEVEPVVVPSRALQLQLSGLVVMADWIASDESHFEGMDDLGLVGLDASRGRAERAWGALGLQGGWGRLVLPGPGFFRDRFGCGPRFSQEMVVRAARRVGGPGVMVVEAPMGEGKTEAALAAVEVLAARFGADGVFVGMPSQATCDPMFTRVRNWLGSIDPCLASRLVLLHGKRDFNKEWKGLLEGVGSGERFAGVDEFGLCDDPYGVCGEGGGGERGAPAEWFLGAKRGLLAPFVVGTVDQLLYAATRTRHVMLRMAGLAGKVVVLDEVHACDVYMGQFLREALRWLGQARVPVVLLSATLPPVMRDELVGAYLAGAAGQEEFSVQVPAPAGYPRVCSAWLDGEGRPQFLLDCAEAWRGDLPVSVEVVGETFAGAGGGVEERARLQLEADAAVVGLLADRLVDGGTALVIRNSVARAQSVYAALAERFPRGEVRLLHARFAAADRARLAEECLRVLGPGAVRGAGDRFVLVATQLAEQSFDVDADVLVTDLAPVDLLLQRVGRLHRHGATWRPEGLRAPRVFVTGVGMCGDGPPGFEFVSERIYGRHLLLRTAAVLPGGVGVWSVAGQVPSLVERVYGDDAGLLPQGWRAVGEAARCEQGEKERRRVEEAGLFLLTRRGEHGKRTLAGLHYGGVSVGGGEESLRAAVRDGDESVEVVLVVREAEGEAYRTLGGRALSVNGDVAPELLGEVLGGAVRLPAKVTADALGLSGLPGWHGHPWLRGCRALVLDASRRGRVGDVGFHYGSEFGLREVREPEAGGRGVEAPAGGVGGGARRG